MRIYYYNDYNESIMIFLVIAKYRVMLLTLDEHVKLSILFNTMNTYGILLTKHENIYQLQHKCNIAFIIAYKKKAYDIYQILKELKLFIPNINTLATIYSHCFNIHIIHEQNNSNNIYTVINTKFSRQNFNMLLYCYEQHVNPLHINKTFINVYKKYITS